MGDIIDLYERIKELEERMDTMEQIVYDNKEGETNEQEETEII